MDKEEIIQIVKETVLESHHAIAQVQSNQYAKIDLKLQENLKGIEGLNGFGKIYKFLRTDMGFLVAFTTFIISVLTPYYLIKNDIALIYERVSNVTTSVETHIKQNQSEMKDIRDSMFQISGRVSRIEGSIGIQNAKTTQ